MPLIEDSPTLDSACISTAVTYTNSSCGHPKKISASWWALRKEWYDPTSSHWRHWNGWPLTVTWVVWLVLSLTMAWFIPFDSILNPTVFGTVFFVLALATFIPDSGQTLVPFLFPFTIPFIVINAISSSALGFFLFIYGVVPILDYVIGVDLTNQDPAEQKKLQHMHRFKWATLLVFPVEFFLILYGCWWANTFEVTILQFMGACFSVGIFSGAVGITVGHELCHKSSLLERISGIALLCSVSYGHFYVEHTLGHHKMVATDEDPSSARSEEFHAPHEEFTVIIIHIGTQRVVGNTSCQVWGDILDFPSPSCFG
jgi:hypothetical protein